MKKDFKPNSIETNAQTIANMLPGGDLFIAKNIKDSNLRKMLISLATELTRLEETIYELSIQYDLKNTVNLIDEWERALGIPDECFSSDGVPVALRQKQVFAKFALMNLVTEEDWKSLANLFGFTIQIIHPMNNNGFDYTFDFYFFDDKTARYTIIIKFMGISAPEDVFDQTFDFTFSADNVLICLFEHLKPANVQIKYEYEL